MDAKTTQLEVVSMILFGSRKYQRNGFTETLCEATHEVISEVLPNMDQVQQYPQALCNIMNDDKSESADWLRCLVLLSGDYSQQQTVCLVRYLPENKKDFIPQPYCGLKPPLYINHEATYDYVCAKYASWGVRGDDAVQTALGVANEKVKANEIPELYTSKDKTQSDIDLTRIEYYRSHFLGDSLHTPTVTQEFREFFRTSDSRKGADIANTLARFISRLCARYSVDYRSNDLCATFQGLADVCPSALSAFLKYCCSMSFPVNASASGTPLSGV